MGLYICDKCDEYRDTASTLVRYFDRPVCEDCFDELSVCSSCLGSGMGNPGHDDRCGVCKGKGEVDIVDVPLEPADHKIKEDLFT